MYKLYFENFIPYLLDLGTYWYVNFQKQAHGLQGVLVIKRFFKILNWLVYILPQNQAAGLVVLIVRLFNCKMLQFRRNSCKSHIRCILLWKMYIF